MLQPVDLGSWCNITWGSWTLRSAPQSKKLFYDVIKDYNIQGIFYGHLAFYLFSAYGNHPFVEN